MRRIVILGVLIGAGAFVLRMRGVKLRERLAAHCGAMFEQMPDTFPPKRMLVGIEDIRAETARIVELLEAEPRQAVHDVA